jgi:hypothetical protein
MHAESLPICAIGAFQGLLNQLSGRSIFLTSVYPFSSMAVKTVDNLSKPLLVKLKKFQAQIGRQILHPPKHHVDLSVLLGLHRPRIRVHIFLRKLTFLGNTRDDLSFCTGCLVEQWQFLESEFRISLNSLTWFLSMQSTLLLKETGA